MPNLVRSRASFQPARQNIFPRVESALGVGATGYDLRSLRRYESAECIADDGRWPLEDTEQRYPGETERAAEIHLIGAWSPAQPANLTSDIYGVPEEEE